MRALENKIRYFAKLLPIYWRETASVGGFLGLLQVRLALSRFVGRAVCPNRIVRSVDIKSFGGVVALRSHTTDISVCDELLVSHSYAHLIRNVEDEVATVVDLGANIGLAARWLAHAFPAARIVAVEPEPGNLEILQLNLSAIADRAMCWPVAVGASDGRAILTTDSGEHGFTILGTGPREGTDVEVITLRRVLDESGIDRVDVLKCDIEGAERDLFADCAEWIALVGWLEIECHEPYRLPDLVKDLRRNGAAFSIVDHVPNPAFGCETVLLRNLDWQAS